MIIIFLSSVGSSSNILDTLHVGELEVFSLTYTEEKGLRRRPRGEGWTTLNLQSTDR